VQARCVQANRSACYRYGMAHAAAQGFTIRRLTPRIPRKRLSFVMSILAGFFFPFLGLIPRLNNAQRCGRSAAQKWISLVLRWSSYPHVTEPVIQSAHYARSAIIRSGAAPTATMGHYLIKVWNPAAKGDFFYPKNYRTNSFIGCQGRASPLGFAAREYTNYRPVQKLGLSHSEHLKLRAY